MPEFNGEIFGIKGEIPYGSVVISPITTGDLNQIKRYPILAELPAYLGIKAMYQSEKVYLVERNVAEQMRKDGVRFVKQGRWPMPKEVREQIREDLKSKGVMAPI